MKMDDDVRIAVNGAERSLPAGNTVRDLLLGLDLHPAMVVVELNGEILDRVRYGEVGLESGDRLELVHFVGGG